MIDASAFFPTPATTATKPRRKTAPRRKPAQLPSSVKNTSSAERYPFPLPVCDEAKFRLRVAQYEMTILQDDGVRRHLQFSLPDSVIGRFCLVTVPGYLIYTGDMGTYVFSRVPDMFRFFGDDKPLGEPIRFSEGYWAEKCVAEDASTGITEWNASQFKAQVWSYLHSDSDEQVPADLLQAVEREVISKADDGKSFAMTAAYEFKHNGFYFDDLAESDCCVYTYRFLWCCYAMVWGVRRYRQAKLLEQVEGV